MDRPEELISLDSTPRLAPGIHVTELDADYKTIVALLRAKSPITDVPVRRVTLVTRLNRDQRTEILQLSEASARLLDLCKNGNAVREIALAAHPAG